MEYDPKDNEIIHLLKKLKDSNGAYPPEMLALRRQGYIKQVAEVGAGAGLAVGLRNLAKGGKGGAGGLSSTAGTVLEAMLVVALVAEAGAVSYFYRGKLAEVFHLITGSPQVEEVASPPVLPSPIVEVQATSSPVITITVTGTETITITPITPSATPPTVLAAETTQPNGTGGVDVQAASTSVPADPAGPAGPAGNEGSPSVSTQDPNGNNGNHYGQTPIPARTKEPGNGTSSTQSDSTNNKKKP
jgi:hypothetical protein